MEIKKRLEESEKARAEFQKSRDEHLVELDKLKGERPTIIKDARIEGQVIFMKSFIYSFLTSIHRCWGSLQ